MKRYTAAILAVLVMSAIAVNAEEGEDRPQEKTEIYFFHNTACSSCDGTEEFLQIVEEQISCYEEQCPYELNIYNVFKTDGYQEWETVSEKYALENESYIFPVMLLSGKMYTGMKEIQEELHEAFMNASGVSAVYFYREDCQECVELEPFWETVPEKFQIQGEEQKGTIVQLESRTGENGKLIRTLFEKYEVPDEDQMVPFVFLKENYLAGKDEIEQNFTEMLEKGMGYLE